MDQSERTVQPLSIFRPNVATWRQGVKHVSDALLAGMAWMVAEWLWFEPQRSLINLTLWTVCACVVGSIFHLTSPLYRLVGIRDIIRIGFGTVTLMLLALALKFLPLGQASGYQVPNEAIFASLLTGMAWATLRIGRRSYFEARFKGANPPLRPAGTLHRTLLVGAGAAGSMVMQELRLHPELGYRIEGFIDDSPEKRGARINGIRVLGNTAEIATVVAKYGITHAVLAMPTAPGQTIRALMEEFQRLQVKVRTVPGIFNLLGARTWKPDIQAISIEDVLRREPVQLDHGALSEAVDGKVVLITGAGGSIGSELTRQMAELQPKLLVLVGRGENSLWQIQRELLAVFPTQQFALELMDIRNRHGLREIFERYRPDVVLHAAAHKHVPFLEVHPLEAVENNIFGTLNVMEAARDFGAKKIVNISTDKAVNPTNVLGASKRIAECIVLDMAEKAGAEARFVSVRFGNVLGSRGSVVPIFKEQIEKGGPLTVTHPAMTRYFMTVPEASQLVIQAALFGDTGRVYVLNMGKPVKIIDLALDMARFSGLTPGRDIKIEFVGLRPGEKIEEELFMEEERSQTRVHPKLMETVPKRIPADRLEGMLESFRAAMQLPFEERQPELVRLLKEFVPTYRPSLLGVGRFGGHVRDRRKEFQPFPHEEQRHREP